MSLSEQVIFDRLTTSFRTAAECCDKLASSPRKGPIYFKLREELRLIEGAARQAGHFREDMRWMKVGVDAAHCQQKAGDWLRSHQKSVIFTKLALSLRKLAHSAEQLRHGKTGRRGMILPVVRDVHRESRPVHVSGRTAGGVWLPPGASVGAA